MSQEKKHTVLLIEADTSLRRLIALGLQHRGMHVIEADSPAQLPSFAGPRFDLLVLDVDNGIHSNWSLLTEVQSPLAPTMFSEVPIIVLAWEYPFAAETSSAVATMARTSVKYLTKPFDARIFYAAIEQLLLSKAEQEAAVLAEAEAILLAAYATHTAPSIWPIVTAIGVLIAFVGLMLQFIISGIGVLIIIVALLLWTLETKPERESAAVGL